MGTTRIVAVAVAATLFFSACGSDDSSSSNEELAALQVQLDELADENAKLRDQLEEATADAATSSSQPSITVPPTTDPEESGPPATDPEPTEATAGQVESLLSFNAVNPTMFPDAVPGEISIVSVLDPSGRDSGLLVLRNGTQQTLTGFEVSVTGRDPAGTLVATGSDQGSVEPTLIGPGQLAIASVYMGVDALPPDTTFEYEIVDVQSDTEFIGSVSVPIVETSPAGMDVLGLVENSTEDEVSGPISILYVCLGSDTEITGYARAFTDQDSLAPGSSSPFRARIYRGSACDRSIAGASGYNF